MIQILDQGTACTDTRINYEKQQRAIERANNGNKPKFQQQIPVDNDNGRPARKLIER